MFGTNLTIELPAEISTWDACAISNQSLNLKSIKPFEAYPILNWDLDSFRIVWEGNCYTQREHFQHLFIALQEALLREDIVPIKLIVKKIQHCTGEFACWMIGKNVVYFFNDQLGRLPVYSFKDNHKFFIGRNLHAFFQQHHRVPDKLGIAQTLWCGYALGNKTLFENVQRVAAGTFLQFSFSTGECVECKNETIDFTVRNRQALNENAESLAESFKQACRKITISLDCGFHLSLSGGQDSRAVLAGFQQSGASLTASSFSFSDADKDSNTAALLAKQLCVPWKNFTIESSNTNDDWLIHLKSGLNYSGMSFIGSYLKQVALEHPGCVMLTGDGGDKVLPYLGEAMMPSSEEHLIMLLLRRHAILDAETALQVCGLHADDLKQSLFERIREYPEKSWIDKSIHFAIFERGAKAYFEGEDRNRFFMWSTTPFYELDFFKLAMSVPDNFKKNYKLYRHFMHRLAPEFMHIPDAAGGTVNSMQFKTRKWVQEQFRSAPFAVKRPLRLMHQALQSVSAVYNSELIPSEIPVSLNFLHVNRFEKLVKKGGTEAALHLRTILKTFA